MTRRCVRCGRPDNHAERLYLDCLHPVPRAPWWLRLKVAILRKLT